ADIFELQSVARTPQARNVLTAAQLVTSAALMRRESRGGHYRSDYPDLAKGATHRTFMNLADLASARPIVLAKTG
ncbi:MAG: L-aspartate oxidase, partial [Alphaproteobacteria bacterium]